MISQKKCQYILMATITLTICFIWGHSMMPRRISSSESGRIVAALHMLWNALSVNYDMADHIVRKCAHFIEYAILGMQLCGLFTIRNSQQKVYEKYPNQNRVTGFLISPVTLAANTTLLVALVDETIQIFSARGPQIQDVWLDLFGGICGAAIVALITRSLIPSVRSYDPGDS